MSDCVKVVYVYPRRKRGQAALGNARPPIHISFDILAPFLHHPQSVAANQLGISCTALKKACRKLGIERWPNTARGEVVTCNRMPNNTPPSTQPHGSDDEDKEDSADTQSIELASPSPYESVWTTPWTVEANEDTHLEQGGWGLPGLPLFTPELDFLFDQPCTRTKPIADATPPDRAGGSSESVTAVTEFEICSKEMGDASLLSGLELLELDPVEAIGVHQSRRCKHPCAASQLETVTTSNAIVLRCLESELWKWKETADVNPLELDLLNLDPLEAICLFQSHRLDALQRLRGSSTEE